MKVYVISEVGWEYNDNFYYQPECGGSSPVIGYKDRLKAERECLKKNADQARRLSKADRLREYLDEDALEDELGEMITKLGCIVDVGSESIKLPSDASDILIMQILDILGIRFYEISELELE